MDRDSVTDPSPAWDHHTLARGLSVPLSRCLRILKKLSPRKYFVGVGRNAPLVGMEGHQIHLLRLYCWRACFVVVVVVMLPSWGWRATEFSSSARTVCRHDCFLFLFATLGGGCGLPPLSLLPPYFVVSDRARPFSDEGHSIPQHSVATKMIRRRRETDAASAILYR